MGRGVLRASNLTSMLSMCTLKEHHRFLTKTEISLITDRVRSTMGRLCFDTCLSICLSTPLAGGGTPAGGYPTLGKPPVHPHRTWPGGYPTSGTPPSDLVGGVPSAGGYPTSGPPPHQTWLGGYPTSGNRWSTWYATVGMPLAFTQGGLSHFWQSLYNVSPWEF